MPMPDMSSLTCSRINACSSELSSENNFLLLVYQDHKSYRQAVDYKPNSAIKIRKAGNPNGVDIPEGVGSQPIKGLTEIGVSVLDLGVHVCYKVEFDVVLKQCLKFRKDASVWMFGRQRASHPRHHRSPASQSRRTGNRFVVVSRATAVGNISVECFSTGSSSSAAVLTNSTPVTHHNNSNQEESRRARRRRRAYRQSIFGENPATPGSFYGIDAAHGHSYHSNILDNEGTI